MQEAGEQDKRRCMRDGDTKRASDADPTPLGDSGEPLKAFKAPGPTSEAVTSLSVRRAAILTGASVKGFGVCLRWFPGSWVSTGMRQKEEEGEEDEEDQGFRAWACDGGLCGCVRRRRRISRRGTRLLAAC